MSFIGNLIRSFIEGRASRASLDELRKGLETGGEKVARRIAHAADTPSNRKQAGHIIGIERWGAQRLRTVQTLVSPPVVDESDGYRPHGDQPMSALSAEFTSARAETLALIEVLRPMQDRRVPHNDLGELSVRGWLVYLSNHAGVESKRLR
jgi:hypothetical protein